MNQTAAKINTALARVLTATAKEEDMTQPDIAKATGIPFRTVQRLMAGDTKINVQHLALIATALDSEPQYLLDRALKRAEKMPDVPVSEAEGTTDEVAKKRRQRDAEGMSVEDLEALPNAAVRDGELDADESSD